MIYHRDKHDVIASIHEAFYIQAMLFSCRSALTSVSAVDSIIKTSKSLRSIEGIKPQVLLDHVQNIILQGAALARYFCPARSGKHELHKRRGELLRRLLNIAEDGALLNRDMRNAVEHFDERLDNFLRTDPVGHFLMQHVGFEDKNSVPTHFFRAFFIDSGTFEVLGQRVSLQPLVDDIVRLHDTLDVCEKDGMRLLRHEL